LRVPSVILSTVERSGGRSTYRSRHTNTFL
jgi:hypothetical protein